MKKLILLLIPKKLKLKIHLEINLNKKIIGIKISPKNNELNKQKLGPAKAIYYAIKETWFVIQASLDF